MENINLIRKIAWSFHYTTKLDIDDLIQEAAYAYLLALKSWNPDKGKITTHAWWVITSHLKNYVKKERQYTEPLDSVDVLRRKPTYQMNFFECLSREAEEALNIMLSGPIPYVTADPELAVKRMRQVLRQLGWDNSKIENALENLANAYS